MRKIEPFGSPAKSKHNSEFASDTEAQAGDDQGAVAHRSARSVG